MSETITSHSRQVSRPVWRRVPLTAALGFTIVGAYVICALFASWIAPYGEYQVVTDIPFGPWNEQNLLGTDQLGRDFLSRLIFGARNSMGIAFVTTMIAFLVGGFIGIAAATLRGWFDQ